MRSTRRKQPLKVVNLNMNGEVIPDMSKVVIPPDHPIYDVLRAISRKQQEAESRAASERPMV